MNTPEDQKRQFERREAELRAKERELRLRELETEIYQEQKSNKWQGATQVPLYSTRKHQPTENSLQKFGRKIVRFVKFTVFVVLGVAMVRVGFLLGMWIAYLVIAGVIAGIGYQIFLRDDK